MIGDDNDGDYKVGANKQAVTTIDKLKEKTQKHAHLLSLHKIGNNAFNSEEKKKERGCGTQQRGWGEGRGGERGGV